MKPQVCSHLPRPSVLWAHSHPRFRHDKMSSQGWRTCLARTHRMLYGQEILQCYFQDRIGSHYQCLSFLLSTLNKMPCLETLLFHQVGMVPALVSCHCKMFLLGKVWWLHNHCKRLRNWLGTNRVVLGYKQSNCYCTFRWGMFYIYRLALHLDTDPQSR